MSGLDVKYFLAQAPDMLDRFVLIRSVMVLFIELMRSICPESGVELIDARTSPIGEWDHVKIINNKE